MNFEPISYLAESLAELIGMLVSGADSRDSKRKQAFLRFSCGECGCCSPDCAKLQFRASQSIG